MRENTEEEGGEIRSAGQGLSEREGMAPKEGIDGAVGKHQKEGRECTAAAERSRRDSTRWRRARAVPVRGTVR